MQPPEAATETPSASKDVNKPHRDSSGIISFSVKPTWHANGLTIRCNPRLQTFAKLKASLGEKKNMKAPPPSSWLLCYVVGAGDPPVSYWQDTQSLARKEDLVEPKQLAGEKLVFVPRLNAIDRPLLLDVSTAKAREAVFKTFKTVWVIGPSMKDTTLDELISGSLDQSESRITGTPSCSLRIEFAEELCVLQPELDSVVLLPETRSCRISIPLHIPIYGKSVKLRLFEQTGIDPRAIRLYTGDTEWESTDTRKLTPQDLPTLRAQLTPQYTHAYDSLEDLFDIEPEFIREDKRPTIPLDQAEPVVDARETMNALTRARALDDQQEEDDEPHEKPKTPTRGKRKRKAKSTGATPQRTSKRKKNAALEEVADESNEQANDTEMADDAEAVQYPPFEPTKIVRSRKQGKAVEYLVAWRWTEPTNLPAPAKSWQSEELLVDNGFENLIEDFRSPFIELSSDDDVDSQPRKSPRRAQKTGKEKVARTRAAKSPFSISRTQDEEEAEEAEEEGITTQADDADDADYAAGVDGGTTGTPANESPEVTRSWCIVEISDVRKSGKSFEVNCVQFVRVLGEHQIPWSYYFLIGSSDGADRWIDINAVPIASTQELISFLAERAVRGQTRF